MKPSYRESVQDKVRQFHETFGQPTGPGEGIALSSLSDERRLMRFSLVLEEFLELAAASGLKVAKGKPNSLDMTAALSSPNVAEMADALGDIVYVCYGMAIEMGVDLDAVIREIHRANMSKLGADGTPIYREDGKVLKGPNYSPPDVAGVILGLK